MSRTHQGSKGPGYEYWSRRPPHKFGVSPGKANKRVTHSLERAAAMRDLITRMKNMGWCGGASIADGVWSLVRPYIPIAERKEIAGKIVDIFEDEDADTMYEAEQLWKDAGRGLEGGCPD